MGASILLIEDNPADQELARYLLEASGYSTLNTNDGDEGLRVAYHAKPSLILCDLDLPHVDGFEVARRLRKHPSTRSIPLVAVTAFATYGDRERVLKAGFDGYISKPIEPTRFVRQVEGFLPPEGRVSFAPEASHAVTSEPSSALTRATILVINQCLECLAWLRSILEPSGFEVITADSRAAALEQARRRAPDVVVSDVPVLIRDGFDDQNCVSSDPRLSSVPVVFLSDARVVRPEERPLAFPEFRWLPRRPVEPRRLLALIEACLWQ
jgi:CheY-like chemotaxis protein